MPDLSLIHICGVKSEVLQNLEKGTKVTVLEEMENLSLIHILIMGHKIGDVDSFGAAVGIYRIARTLERRAQIVLNDVTTSLRPKMCIRDRRRRALCSRRAR